MRPGTRLSRNAPLRFVKQAHLKTTKSPSYRHQHKVKCFTPAPKLFSSPPLRLARAPQSLKGRTPPSTAARVCTPKTTNKKPNNLNDPHRIQVSKYIQPYILELQQQMRQKNIKLTNHESPAKSRSHASLQGLPAAKEEKCICICATAG